MEALLGMNTLASGTQHAHFQPDSVQDSCRDIAAVGQEVSRKHCHLYVTVLAGGHHNEPSPFYTAGNPRFNPAAVYTGMPSSQPVQHGASGGNMYNGGRSGGGGYQAAAPQPLPPSSSFYSGPMGRVPAPTPFPTGVVHLPIAASLSGLSME